MASLLQMDIKDLFKKKKKNGDQKSSQQNITSILIKRIAVVILILVAMICLYIFFLKPILDEQELKKKQINEWDLQTSSCKEEILNLKNLISNLERDNIQKGGLFVDNEEFDNFYGELTQATITYNLRIIDISRAQEEPVLISEKDDLSSNNYDEINTISIVENEIPCSANIDQVYSDLGLSMPFDDYSNSSCDQGNSDDCEKIAYYKMMVNYEIRGSFIDYLKFRDILANKKKIVNIEKEKIIRDNEVPGQIITNATVSLVKAVE